MTPLHRRTPFPLTPRVLQFGAGNFLRGFVDWQLDLLNERCGLDAGVIVVRPTGSTRLPLLDVQDGLFTTLVQGLDEQGQPMRETRLIQCVQRELQLSQHFDDYLALASLPTLRFVVSNTTEAGIQINQQDRFEDRPPSSFPAKLARWLHARYQAFGGAAERGVYVLPCELIDDNGPALRDAVLHFARLWALEPGFIDWLQQSCHWCSTLVDRIVPGRPDAELDQLQAQLGYSDQFLVAAEPFYLWVIQGPEALAQELRLAQGGLQIELVDDIRPYKQRKVGVLNGGHTCLVPVALLAGVQSVGEAMADPQLRAYLQATLDQDIIPALPLPREALEPFAQAVLRRFANPYIHHKLSAIALNSWSKFAARVMPQLLRRQAQSGEWPARLVLALAATMWLYRGELIELADEPARLAWWQSAWSRYDAGSLSLRELVQHALADTTLWGRDLSALPGLVDSVRTALADLSLHGVRAALRD